MKKYWIYIYIFTDLYISIEYTIYVSHAILLIFIIAP